MNNSNSKIRNHNTSNQFKPNEKLVQTTFIQREYQISHLTYEQEFSFYQAVKEGNKKKVISKMLPLKNEKLGHLSDNPVRNLKYHLIITIALITRFCIEGGMIPEAAYTLSDIYIQKLDLCTAEQEITDLHKEVILNYTKKMKQINKETEFSKAILMTMDYVYDHLHEKITLDSLATFVGYNKTYICDLFKKETGITIGTYINKRKFEAAKNMLLYTSFTTSEIAEYLAFSSQSHFIQSFKKETGLTPKKFQNINSRSHFKNDLFLNNNHS